MDDVRGGLQRRLLDTLVLTRRAVEEFGATERGGKVVAEAAMLLHVAAPVAAAERRVGRAAAALAARVAPHARSGEVLVALCLDPGRARDHALAHVVLTRLGYPDAGTDQLLDAALADAPGVGPERLPYRELEQQWLGRLRDAAGSAGPGERGVLARSALGRRLDALGHTPLDAYALTHAVLYATDAGSRRVALPRPAADVAADAEVALAAALAAGNLDLAAELLWTWPVLGLPWSPAAAFGIALLGHVHDELGLVPGPGAGLDARPVRPLPVGLLADCYHTAVVEGMLLACALRPGCLPPPVEVPGTDWRASRGPGVAGLRLVADLQQARRDGDMTALRRTLADALDAGLPAGPGVERAVPQAVALLRRATALESGVVRPRVPVQSGSS
jgi:hypothetical protein